MRRSEPEDLRSAAPERPRDRRELIIAGLLAVAMLAVGISTINPYPVGVLHDDAVYVILAKSLATGHGYRYLNLPGEPLATHFPPGYPLFLAALWRLADFPRNIFFFKCANALLLVAGYLALGALLRRRSPFSPRVAWAVAAVAVAGVPMLLVSTLVLSETLFFVAAVVTLVVAERAVERPTTRGLVVVGVLCGVAALVRTPGVALVAATVGCLLLRRRVRDAAIVAAASALLLVPWQLWSQIHGRAVPDVLQGAYGSYGAWLGDAIREQGITLLFKTMAVTSRQAADVIAAAVSPSTSLAFGYFAAACLLPIAALGMYAAWKSMPVVAAFLVFYVAMVLIWPSPPARYIWGMWPLVIAVLALGIRALVQLPRLGVRIALAVVTFVPAFGYAKYNVTGYRDTAWQRIPQQGGLMMRPLVIEIGRRTAHNAVVATTAEAAVYLYTGRLAVPMYRFTVDELFRGPDVTVQTRALEDILKAYPVDAIVASTGLQRTALSRVDPPGSIVPVDSFPGAVIYRRR